MITPLYDAASGQYHLARDGEWLDLGADGFDTYGDAQYAADAMNEREDG